MIRPSVIVYVLAGYQFLLTMRNKVLWKVVLLCFTAVVWRNVSAHGEFEWERFLLESEEELTALNWCSFSFSKFLRYVPYAFI